MSSDNATAAALAMVGLVAMSASSVAAFLMTKEEEEETTTPTTTEEEVVVVSPEEITPSNCQGTTKVLKRACHNPETGELLDGSPGKCGDGKEEYALDPDASGYVAAVGDGTCPTSLEPCFVDCPAPCSGGEWTDDPNDFCGVITYDNENPPNKIKTRLDGTTLCGKGVINTVLDESRNNFVEAKGKGDCAKERLRDCTVECPAGMSPVEGCSYYANRQSSNNGCMKVDANGNALEYKIDKSNNVGCGESGKQEFFYLIHPSSTGSCNKLSDWQPCTSDTPCPIDCVGGWRSATPSNPEGWEACVGACETQPQRKRVYEISRDAQWGGRACAIPEDAVRNSDGTYTQTEPCGKVQQCCVMGTWQDVEGAVCSRTGYIQQERGKTERSPGACSGEATSQDAVCCYEGDDWAKVGDCGTHQTGQQKYRQTTAGNCAAGTETKYEPCTPCSTGSWTNVGTCGQYQTDKQKQTRTVSGDCSAGTASENYEPCTYRCDYTGSNVPIKESSWINKYYYINDARGTSKHNMTRYLEECAKVCNVETPGCKAFSIGHRGDRVSCSFYNESYVANDYLSCFYNNEGPIKQFWRKKSEPSVGRDDCIDREEFAGDYKYRFFEC